MTDNRKFVDDALKAHNAYRHRHQVPALKHDKELTAIAQGWAEHLASKGAFQHSNNRTRNGERLGENIAMKWHSGGGDYTGQEVTDQWYSEVKQYPFGQDGSGRSGHFTQVVWKSSKLFGIGRAKGQDGRWIVVANYSPAGNVIGQYTDNVFPPKDGKTSLIGQEAADVTTTETRVPGWSFGRQYVWITPKVTKRPSHQHLYGMSYNTSASYSASMTPHTAEPERRFSDSRSFHSENRLMEERGRTSGGRVVSRSTRTTSEGVGAGRRTKTVVTETIVTADGTKKTITTETITTGD